MAPIFQKQRRIVQEEPSIYNPQQQGQVVQEKQSFALVQTLLHVSVGRASLTFLLCVPNHVAPVGG